MYTLFRAIATLCYQEMSGIVPELGPLHHWSTRMVEEYEVQIP
jgi:hypothetical protein